jgi:hypothetical protein
MPINIIFVMQAEEINMFGKKPMTQLECEVEYNLELLRKRTYTLGATRSLLKALKEMDAGAKRRLMGRLHLA